MVTKRIRKASTDTPVRFIDLDAVIELTSLRKTTIYQMMRNGEFPRQRVISKRSVRWVESEIQAWMRRKVGS